MDTGRVQSEVGTLLREDHPGKEVLARGHPRREVSVKDPHLPDQNRNGKATKSLSLTCFTLSTVVSVVKVASYFNVK